MCLQFDCTYARARRGKVGPGFAKLRDELVKELKKLKTRNPKAVIRFPEMTAEEQAEEQDIREIHEEAEKWRPRCTGGRISYAVVGLKPLEEREPE